MSMMMMIMNMKIILKRVKMSVLMMMDEATQARCIFLSFALRLQSNCHTVDDDDYDGYSNEDVQIHQCI